MNCFEKKIHGLKLSKTITIQTALESERAVNAEKRLRCHQYVAQFKRGIMDLETLKKVNVDRISTIEETIKIQQEGRAACQNAEVELAGIEE